MTLLATLAIFSTPVLSQRTPNENLVLADCGVLSDKGTQLALYYSDNVWSGTWTDNNQPQMVTAIPWSGAHPWYNNNPNVNGLSVRTSNGDDWSIHLDFVVTPPNPAGDAWHSYEWDLPLKCYRYPFHPVYKLEDGTQCYTAYVCNHRGRPYSPAVCDALKEPGE